MSNKPKCSKFLMNQSPELKHGSLRILMYLSKSTESEVKGTLPQCIVNIITVSRKKNQKSGLSGILSYSDGYFLQIIEGQDKAIDELLVKLNKDSRHENLSVLVDKIITRRYFNDKPLKLEPAMESNLYFSDFIKKNVSTLADSVITPKKVIEHYTSSHLSKRKQEAAKTSYQSAFSNYEIKLKAWPRFGSKLPSKEFMELCALISQPIAYPLLILRNPYSSEDELNRVLEKLNNSDLLSVNKLLSPPVINKVDGGAFFNKMKSFLGRIR